ncbi:Lipase 3, partial [Frankliniella fusca]
MTAATVHLDPLDLAKTLRAFAAVSATLLALSPVLLTLCSDVPDPASLARSHGYAAESHTAQTDDGYLLSVFRIRNSSSSGGGGAHGAPGALPPVLLVPGLACNAAIWVLLGPGKALAYLLADRGYDVWLTDYRGAMFSRRHVNLSDQDSALDDIGRLDIPAVLDLVLRETGSRSLSYVGHSMGASVLSVMASARPELADRIAHAYLFAPAAYMAHASQPAVYGSAGAVSRLHDDFGLFASGEIPLNSWWMHMTMHSLCSSAVASPLCLLVGGVYAGHDSEQINKTAIPFYLDYIPDSISVKNVRHFTQHFGKEHDFRRFDYGLPGNLAVYGQAQSPQYNISRSKFPASIYYGTNDVLVNPK